MSELARVLVEERSGIPVAALDGEVDASNAAAVAMRLRECVTNGSAALVVDLTTTAYLDSAGINALFELGASLRDRQQRLHVVVPPTSPVARMLAIVGLASEEATHPTLADALAAAATADA